MAQPSSTQQTVAALPAEDVAWGQDWLRLNGNDPMLVVNCLAQLRGERRQLERELAFWKESATKNGEQLTDALQRLRTAQPSAIGTQSEETIAALLVDLELVNYMTEGAPRHHRKSEYERIRAFLISLAPGVVLPDFERKKE